MPKWMRTYLIGYLSGVFCFFEEKRTSQSFPFMTRNDSTASAVTSKSHAASEQISKELLQPMLLSASTGGGGAKTKPDLNNMSNNVAHTNHNEYSSRNHRSIVIECPFGESTAGNIAAATSSTNINNNNNNNNNCNSANNARPYSRHKSKQHSGRVSTSTIGANEAASHNVALSVSNTGAAPFSENIANNLEKMLMKLQRSFDPFKLHDEQLKFQIIKEILECQRLLLSANASRDRKDKMTINEIYEEWKVLAMIVDRMCFFLYLLALAFSSLLFYLNERDST